MILPELGKRYPGVPVILCATKCDDVDDDANDNGGDGDNAAAAAAVVSTPGNGDLAVINEEDRYQSRHQGIYSIIGRKAKDAVF